MYIILMSYSIVYTTLPSIEKAKGIGNLIVSQHLVACVNIIDNMKSIYMWEGKLEESSEVILIAKTLSSKVSEVIKKINEHHSYDCPCIISYKIEEGDKKFLKWIETSVNPDIN
jgi:periplasmic divalent cation tolerance protein